MPLQPSRNSAPVPRGTFDLTGKRALVTGARRGIGLAMATALARAGADIVAVSATLEPSGSEIQQAVEGMGRQIELHTVDLAERRQVDRFLADLAHRGVSIDILVNNAGVISRAPAVDSGDDAWDYVLEVNLTSAFRLSRALARPMLQRGRGKIIFTASVLSFQGGILVPSYTASKSGLVGLARALSNEWAGRGVNVNAIVPGYIATDGNAALRSDPDREKAILERIPAGRWGEPDDLAGATLFLASSASDYVHGTVVAVDGGWLGR